MKSSQPKETDTETQSTGVSPISTMQTPIDDGKCVVISPVEKAAYFPDDKICMSVGVGQAVEERQTGSNPSQSLTSKYEEAELPKRPDEPPFWRRHLLWIVAGFIILVILIALSIGISAASHEGKGSQMVPVVTNNTRNSVASSGLILKDGTTWNMHVFSQNSTGGINLQVALDGNQFEPAQSVPLTITPKTGSPLTATAEQDAQTGVIMINLFYLSGDHNITMSAIACASGSAKCNTISNCLLPTNIPTHQYTGLSAVNVNEAEDWRVYYHDNKGFISELAGNSSGFDMGNRIGGSGLNASSIATVNVNSTTNNIVLFYVDNFTQNLYTMQFIGSWTTPLPVSTKSFSAWNPLSGLGAAYSVGLDQLHVYFTGLDQKIYDFVGSSASKTTNTVWAQQPTSQRVWANADYLGADIAAVGWKNQVRFFQVSQDNLVQGVLNNLTWTESFVA